MAWDEQAIQGYLIDVDGGGDLEFQYNPSEVLDDKATMFAAIRVPGMSHPRYQYVSGEPRKIVFRLHFFKGPVRERVAWLQSLLYPEHAGTMLETAPHRVLLVFGDLFPGVLCIVRQVKARFHGLFEPETLLPQQAEVDIVLEEYIDESVSVGEVRG
jgi:hypothetical protein